MLNIPTNLNQRTIIWNSNCSSKWYDPLLFSVLTFSWGIYLLHAYEYMAFNSCICLVYSCMYFILADTSTCVSYTFIRTSRWEVGRGLYKSPARRGLVLKSCIDAVKLQICVCARASGAASASLDTEITLLRDLLTAHAAKKYKWPLFTCVRAISFTKERNSTGSRKYSILVSRWESLIETVTPSRSFIFDFPSLLSSSQLDDLFVGSYIPMEEFNWCQRNWWWKG